MGRAWAWYLSRPKWQGIALAVVLLFVVVGIGSAISDAAKRSSQDYAAGEAVGEEMGRTYRTLSGDRISNGDIRGYCDEAAFQRIQSGRVESRDSFVDGCAKAYRQAVDG